MQTSASADDGCGATLAAFSSSADYDAEAQSRAVIFGEDYRTSHEGYTVAGRFARCARILKWQGR